MIPPGLTVLVPHTRIHPVTARLANKHAPGHVRVQIDPADLYAYWRLLTDAWRQPGSTLVLEHDIGLRAGVVEALADCPEPWCGNPYPLDGGVILACLGCTRFTAALKAAEPDLLDVVGEITHDGLPAKDWRRLDVRLGDELKRRGYQLHVHQPVLAHYHSYLGVR